MSAGIHTYGAVPSALADELQALLLEVGGLPVRRGLVARSSTPFPASQDLESALRPALLARGFEHRVRFRHPRSGDGFEYDFWRAADETAMEVMGYRADDEIFKDILKFHVHERTRVGIVWVPRWKWVSGKRSDANFRATVKGLAFADSYMRIDALVAVAYDWTKSVADPELWNLVVGEADIGE
ncbi:MAG: hypothetical protein H6745_14625 [Deltaproteobacteria bacterium]|nr:hypothetical protein [Deltaproteobacteria bacterium]